MTPEFDLIARHFTRPSPGATLGVGDDAALLKMTPGMQFAISTDLLVSGTHFLPETDPRRLGWKTLAVNVSDLAAMGATPRWATLALALPSIDESWVAAFASGFFECADACGVELVGGDTTRGPLTLGVTIMGEVPQGSALRRDAGRPGDDIWVSGSLGGAALGLAVLQHQATLTESECLACIAALEVPQPRVALGLALRGIAHAAIDISDGLLADLGHILERSQLGARIHFDALPAHPALCPRLHEDWARNCLLAGGDDYELCFTAPVSCREAIDALSLDLALPLTRIGTLLDQAGLSVLDPEGKPMSSLRAGYDHFV
jgi:thiamine-monophosphate kinase